MTVYPLWEGTFPGTATETPAVTFYPPAEKKSDAAVVIFPGGGYHHRAKHEGEGYAEFLNGFGIAAFVVDYRVTPAYFPDPLLDARRAVRFVRANAERFGIDPQKIAVMGSSAGGHLAALVSTYLERIEGEGVDAIDEFDALPNAQVLCYPVISSDERIAHVGSFRTLLGDR
ncbi:MAG: alpha/beta hydrolase, partial [Clostridia bacterium]|nr:alpha/beta hydrolase [Clostridia bacterium]